MFAISFMFVAPLMVILEGVTLNSNELATLIILFGISTFGLCKYNHDNRKCIL